MYTWSYTIMGNEKAWEFWDRFFDLCHDHLTDEEVYKYPENLPNEILCILVERCYKELIGLAFLQKSRLSFQVLGYFLMSYGAKMTEDVKKLILKNSQWKDDRTFLKDKKDRLERKKYLFDFRKKILNYKSGTKVKIPVESVTQVCDRELNKVRKIILNIKSYIQRTPILE